MTDLIFQPSLTLLSTNLVFQNDYDMIDYLNELREGCLESYTGIIQGLKGDQTEPNRNILSFLDFMYPF